MHICMCTGMPLCSCLAVSLLAYVLFIWLLLWFVNVTALMWYTYPYYIPASVLVCMLCWHLNLEGSIFKAVFINFNSFDNTVVEDIIYKLSLDMSTRGQSSGFFKGIKNRSYYFTFTIRKSHNKTRPFISICASLLILLKVFWTLDICMSQLLGTLWAPFDTVIKSGSRHRTCPSQPLFFW